MDYDKAAAYWTEKEEKQLERGALKEKIDAFLAGHRTCALATADGDFVRCTPIEYTWHDDCFWLFSEGGLKFRALKNNKNAALAIYNEYTDFSSVCGMQVMGKAEIIEPWSEPYTALIELKHYPLEAMKKMPEPMNLIRITPSEIDFLDSSLKKEGVSSRQHYQF